MCLVAITLATTPGQWHTAAHKRQTGLYYGWSTSVGLLSRCSSYICRLQLNMKKTEVIWFGSRANFMKVSLKKHLDHSWRPSYKAVVAYARPQCSARQGAIDEASSPASDPSAVWSECHGQLGCCTHYVTPESLWFSPSWVIKFNTGVTTVRPKCSPYDSRSSLGHVIMFMMDCCNRTGYTDTLSCHVQAASSCISYIANNHDSICLILFSCCTPDNFVLVFGDSIRYLTFSWDCAQSLARESSFILVRQQGIICLETFALHPVCQISSNS